MSCWLDPAEELREADALRSRAHLLRQLGADGLAKDFEAVAAISERKARALSRINLPSDIVLTPRARSQEQLVGGATP